jgi:hypothetical protein
MIAMLQGLIDVIKILVGDTEDAGSPRLPPLRVVGAALTFGMGVVQNFVFGLSITKSDDAKKNVSRNSPFRTSASTRICKTE